MLKKAVFKLFSGVVSFAIIYWLRSIQGIDTTLESSWNSIKGIGIEAFYWLSIIFLGVYGTIQLSLGVVYFFKNYDDA